MRVVRSGVGGKRAGAELEKTGLGLEGIGKVQIGMSGKVEGRKNKNKEVT